ncbi:Uncharacterised protein [Enterobacter cloacae]|nr:Uncharacterised protein [Enterobacter cloacae]
MVITAIHMQANSQISGIVLTSQIAIRLLITLKIAIAVNERLPVAI